MTEPRAVDTEETDPGLRGAADLLRGLSSTPPPASLAPSVVEAVRPVAQRRRRLLYAVAAAAALGTLAWGLVLLRSVGEGP